MPRARTHCSHGHEWTEENTAVVKNGRTRRCLICKRASDLACRERNRDRRAAAHAARTDDSGDTVRYLYDTWLNGGTLYVKVTAVEYERASTDSFALAARRRARKELLMRGYDDSLAKGIGALVQWDRSFNWADLLTESMTFQLTRTLPVADAAAA